MATGSSLTHNYSRSQSESETSFPEENATMPYTGFEPEPTRLQAEGHIYHTGWAASWS
ncbi:hypothetical protein TNCV_3274091 [Trichonephila clavipes]|nr:hypothetical protein TNCV_3274091 [Trichonephila clavipes]